MHEELEQFSRNNVWDFVPKPKNTNIIGTKWIIKNKSDEFGNIVRNKARLVDTHKLRLLISMKHLLMLLG